MHKVALIHTVQSVLANFGTKIIETIGNIEVTNTLDEYLASDAAQKGEFTVNNMNRLFNIINCAEMTEPDAILVTCSTLSPTVEKIKPFVNVPLVAIDDAMTKKAVKTGKDITVLATAQSTIEPTKSKLLLEAEKIKKDINISVIVCDDAYTAIKAGDKEYHDKILKNESIKIRQQDVVVLAQASMAHLETDIQNICGCPVLSSPKLCIDQLNNILNHK